MLPAIYVLLLEGGGSATSSPPLVPEERPDDEKIQASRFLAQASMGGSVEEIDALAERISEIGHIEALEEWIDDQFSLPRGPTILSKNIEMMNTDAQFNSRANYGNNPSNDWWYHSWWADAMVSNEQLRHRMGYALSQIFVVSENYWNGLYRSRFRQHIQYYDLLMDNAFTSHEEILNDVSYSAMMGVWLSFAQNSKADPVAGTFPDENYAREIMQLFSVGVFARDAYGRVLTDPDGIPLENYDNNDIREMAEVFTGLSIVDQRGFFTKNLTLLRDGVLKMENDYHDMSEKNLLNGVVLPAGQRGEADIAQAIAALAVHPSTAPYFSSLLIKRFTSSNPSPDYIKRVTDTWNGDGQFGNGQVGDFKAVIKAILLDTEVRDSVNLAEPDNVINATLGKIKEPIIKLTQLYRLLGIESDSSDGHIRVHDHARAVGMRILAADTVFNFYSPDFAPSSGPIGQYVLQFEDNNPGETFLFTSPESQFLGVNVIGEFESVHALLDAEASANGTNPSHDDESNDDNPRLQKYRDMVSDRGFENDEALINFFNVYYCHGQMPNELSDNFDSNFDVIAADGNVVEEEMAKLLSVIFSSPACSVVN